MRRELVVQFNERKYEAVYQRPRIDEIKKPPPFVRVAALSDILAGGW